MFKLTAIIIVKDEEQMIADCVKSLKWVDEILVVDTGSNDATVDISRKNGARIVKTTDEKTFAEWRNKGLKEAKGEWVLYVDADERIGDSLKNEILSVISSDGEFSYYAIPRSNFIFGKEFRHGGWWPDYVKRLYKKEKLKKWRGDLHEEPVIDGEIGHLKNHMLHLKHETIFEMVEKTNKWSAIEANLMYEANHPKMNIIRFCTAMFREFWYRMVVKRAFLDGKKGVIMAIYQVFSRFCSYAKLWERQLK